MVPDSALIAALRKSQAAHKYSHGHALVLAGGVGRGGAARLAARGALRMGAGLVTVACPPAALQENAARLDAIMLRPLRDGAALGAMLDDPRLTALCLGPGLGLGAREAGLVEAALQARITVILDADALTLLAQSPDLRALLHPSCILTPHEGEFARLCPDLAAGLRDATTSDARAAIVTQAAQDLGAVVLLKGPLTVIAAPDGAVATSAASGDRAAPWLATAGSGDVLAGFITGLAARGVAPMQAAIWGAYLHLEAALDFGPGLIAEDLPERLPKIFRRLGV
jgi:hydroxyethylthiazole kinase-like uncharacterized protein yjeF